MRASPRDVRWALVSCCTLLTSQHAPHSQHTCTPHYTAPTTTSPPLRNPQPHRTHAHSLTHSLAALTPIGSGDMAVACFGFASTPHPHPHRTHHRTHHQHSCRFALRAGHVAGQPLLPGGEAAAHGRRRHGSDSGTHRPRRIQGGAHVGPAPRRCVCGALQSAAPAACRKQ